MKRISTYEQTNKHEKPTRRNPFESTLRLLELEHKDRARIAPILSQIMEGMPHFGFETRISLPTSQRSANQQTNAVLAN